MLHRGLETALPQQLYGAIAAIRDFMFEIVEDTSEDKDGYVRPLVNGLTSRGLKVWFDEFSLTPGDNLRASIDRGLTSSRFCIVVLSPRFFAKNWTKWELDGIVQRQVDSRESIVIPIWLDVKREDVAAYSPSLANIVAINAQLGTDATVQLICEPVGRANPEPRPDSAPIHQAVTLAHSLIFRASRIPTRISVFVRKGDALELLARYPPSPHALGLQLDIKHSVVGVVARRGAHVVIQNFRGLEQAPRFTAMAPQIASAILLPIPESSEASFVVVCDSPQRYAFVDDELRVRSLDILRLMSQTLLMG